MQWCTVLALGPRGSYWRRNTEAAWWDETRRNERNKTKRDGVAARVKTRAPPYISLSLPTLSFLFSLSFLSPAVFSSFFFRFRFSSPVLPWCLLFASLRSLPSPPTCVHYRRLSLISSSRPISSFLPRNFSGPLQCRRRASLFSFYLPLRCSRSFFPSFCSSRFMTRICGGWRLNPHEVPTWTKWRISTDPSSANYFRNYARGLNIFLIHARLFPTLQNRVLRRYLLIKMSASLIKFAMLIEATRIFHYTGRII